MVKSRKLSGSTRKIRGGGKIMNKIRSATNKMIVKAELAKMKLQNMYNSTFQRYGGGRTRKLKGRR